MAVLSYSDVNNNSKYNKIKRYTRLVFCNYQQNVWLVLRSSTVAQWGTIW